MDAKQLNKAFDEIAAMAEDAEPGRALLELRFDYGNFYVAKAKVKEHIAWMVPEAKKFVDEGRLDKAGRWLGFMQGALWAAGVASIDDFRRMNMGEGKMFEPVLPTPPHPDDAKETFPRVSLDHARTGRTQSSRPNESNKPKSEPEK